MDTCASRMINIAVFSEPGISNRSKYRGTRTSSQQHRRCSRVLRFIRVSTSVRHTVSPAMFEQPRMFEQKRPTSDAPSGADLLGRRPTGREENSSQRVEFPKEREFRLFGLTEWRRSFPPLFLSAGLWKLADKSFLLFEQQLFDN